MGCGMLTVGEVETCPGAGGVRELPVLSAQFCCEPKTAGGFLLLFLFFFGCTLHHVGS